MWWSIDLSPLSHIFGAGRCCFNCPGHRKMNQIDKSTWTCNYNTFIPAHHIYMFDYIRISCRKSISLVSSRPQLRSAGFTRRTPATLPAVDALQATDLRNGTPQQIFQFTAVTQFQDRKWNVLSIRNLRPKFMRMNMILSISKRVCRSRKVVPVWQKNIILSIKAFHNSLTPTTHPSSYFADTSVQCKYKK